MYNRNVLVVSSEDMEPTTSDSLRKAAKAIGIGYAAIRYAGDNGRDFIKRFENESEAPSVKVFFIKWC